MSARFILSLDCEGKWGVADHLTDRHRGELSGVRLGEAYRSILSLLDRFEVPATFAFVGAFSQSAKAFARIRPGIEAFRPNAPDYLGSALNDLDESGGDGWHGADFVDLVTQARAFHEIALHGVTHVPWTDLDEAAAEAELGLLPQLEGPIRQSVTFVYPRNLVAHTKVLADHGIEGFRAARVRLRLSSLLSEFNVFEQPDRPAPPDRIVHIPAGFFLNWRHGLRRLVPPEITAARAKRLLDAAAQKDGVVHFWLHPENVASTPSTLGLLKLLLSEVSAAREAGRCDVMTQLAYCRWVESLH